MEEDLALDALLEEMDRASCDYGAMMEISEQLQDLYVSVLQKAGNTPGT